jgi:hypothetical protein
MQSSNLIGIQAAALKRIHGCVDLRPDGLRDFAAPILYL